MTDPIDIHVGSRVRLRRTMLGMSQEQLADALGLTFQQVQKYERGTNRIASSRLYKISDILQAPVDYFFEDAGEQESAGRTSATPTPAEAKGLSRRETLELMRAYYKIRSPKVRRQIFDFIDALGKSGQK